MKKLIALIGLIALTATSADLTLVWVNDAGNPVGTQTIVSWGIAPGVYTNSMTVAYGVSSVTLTNLAAGRRYYAAVRATDGTDFSVYSNEDSAKTKLNAPKNLTVNP